MLLTLSSLIENSDGVVNVFNDDVLATCRELLKLKRPSYAAMNSVIA